MRFARVIPNARAALANGRPDRQEQIGKLGALLDQVRFAMPGLVLELPDTEMPSISLNT